jgi:hypothetical protein
MGISDMPGNAPCPKGRLCRFQPREAGLVELGRVHDDEESGLHRLGGRAVEGELPHAVALADPERNAAAAADAAAAYTTSASLLLLLPPQHFPAVCCLLLPNVCTYIKS